MDKQLSAESEGVELAFDGQAFQLECGADGHKDVIALSTQGACG